MLLARIRVRGLRGAEQVELGPLAPLHDLPAGRAGSAVADALELLAAALDPHSLPRRMVALGLAPDDEALALEVQGGLPDQVELPSPPDVATLLPLDGSRQVTVDVEVTLDPPLFGQLRQHAARDPRLVTALGQGSAILIKVGWLFTNDLSTASPGLLGFAVGEEGFPVVGAERPAWLGPLLNELGARFGRVRWDEPPARVATRLLDAQLSADPERRRRFRLAAEALAMPPFELGQLEIVRVGDRYEPTFGPGLLRVRQLGPGAAEALRLVEAVFLQAPDVLVVEGAGACQVDPAAVRAWLEQRATAEDATLEQVLLVAAGGP